MKNKFNLVIIALIALIVIFIFADPDKNKTVTNQNTAIPPAASPAASPESQKTGGSVNAATFAQLKTGMKYADVVKIFGLEGEVLSENEMGGFKTVMYKWDGAGFGANVNVMFQNGKLVSKSQFGLK